MPEVASVAPHAGEDAISDNYSSGSDSASEVNRGYRFTGAKTERVSTSRSAQRFDVRGSSKRIRFDERGWVANGLVATDTSVLETFVAFASEASIVQPEVNLTRRKSASAGWRFMVSRCQLRASRYSRTKSEKVENSRCCTVGRRSVMAFVMMFSSSCVLATRPTSAAM